MECGSTDDGAGGQSCGRVSIRPGHEHKVQGANRGASLPRQVLRRFQQGLKALGGSPARRPSRRRGGGLHRSRVSGRSPRCGARGWRPGRSAPCRRAARRGRSPRP